MGSPASLYLFQHEQDINDIVGYITVIADSKCKAFNLAWGCSKGFRGHINYNGLVVCTDNSGVNHQHVIDRAASPKDLFGQIENFLKAL